MAERSRILVVDDKLALAETLADGLLDRGYAARATGSSREALEAVTRGELDLLVTDLRMPGIDGLALVEASRAPALDIPVIVMTAYGAIDSAVESIRRGAYHYLTKPFKLDELVVFLERALAERTLRREAAALREAVREQFSIAGLVGASPAMQRVLAVVARVARTDAPMLITGETGSGKGAIARAIHGESPRARGPFVVVNCAALPEPLLESELFGHVKGAFTGATADRPGLFAEAEGGTLLLDEIGEMSAALQAKLLHVLESRRIRPVGTSGERAIDVRVLAATHRDLRRRIHDGSFREDLLYRLDVVTIEVPPLRERASDIPRLVDRFLGEARGRHPGSSVIGVTRDTLKRLCEYPWPGNVRELAHVVERCVLLADGQEATPQDLPPHVREQRHDAVPVVGGEIMAMRDVQRRYARWAFEQLGGQKSRTADRLDVDIKTLNRWLALEDEN
ncbi:MAG TPA: sigma-54 dependent transcriptional regulator [Kofleriaceae bacterium]|nr:sigma-54 dependent transcriptional regulator [Kofleriaceae bacterium]